jgi:polyhydroxybutyrate depolymerase
MTHRRFACLAMALALGLHGASALAQDSSLGQRVRDRLQQRQQTAPADVQPGDAVHILEVGGLKRQYLVHVPTGYDPAQKAPVLVALHGGGGNMRLQADDSRYGLVSKSNASGFLAVFPNGYSAWPGGRLATWNAGACCGSARDKAIDDVGFVRAVVADVQRRYSVDAQRVYATGMSNGGMLAHRLACEAADVFAGVAAVAGTDNTLACTPSRAIPVLHIHARDDDHVQFNGGAGPKAFRDESKVTNFRSVPETITRWVQRNACAPTPARVLERPGASCERYSGCAGGAAVQLCVTDTGGHSWPGAEAVRRGKEGASQALSANDVMWAFFEGR